MGEACTTNQLKSFLLLTVAVEVLPCDVFPVTVDTELVVAGWELDDAAGVVDVDTVDGGDWVGGVVDPEAKWNTGRLPLIIRVPLKANLTLPMHFILKASLPTAVF